MFQRYICSNVMFLLKLDCIKDFLYQMNFILFACLQDLVQRFKKTFNFYTDEQLDVRSHDAFYKHILSHRDLG